jgi:hypothetical protein
VARTRHVRGDSCSSVASEKSLEGAMVTGSYSKKRLAVVENPQTFAPTQVSRHQPLITWLIAPRPTDESEV